MGPGEEWTSETPWDHNLVGREAGMPPVCLGQLSGPEGLPPLSSQGLPGSPRGLIQRMGTTGPEGPGAPRRGLSWVCSGDGQGKSHLFLKNSLRWAGLGTPQEVGQFPRVPWGQEERGWFLRIFKNSPRKCHKFPVSPGQGSPLADDSIRRGAGDAPGRAEDLEAA